MKLYIKQHIFSWGDRFSIYDESGAEVYHVKGEIFSLGKKLHLYDRSGNEIAYISQKLFSFLPRYYIHINGREIAEVVKNISFFRPEYTVKGLAWNVRGDFFAHEYEVTGGGIQVASVHKEWFTWGDAYAIDITPGIDEIAALAVVLVIDAVISDSRNN